MTLDERMSREAVQLLRALAIDAGERTVRVYAPGLVALCDRYLENTKDAPTPAPARESAAA